jgi:hypothetical protein
LNLARFGYILVIKLRKKKDKQNPFKILGYWLKLIILKFSDLKFLFQNLENFGSFFSMENPLNRSKSYFSSWNLKKNCPPVRKKLNFNLHLIDL